MRRVIIFPRRNGIWKVTGMELVTTAFKIAVDERYKKMKKKIAQVQDIIDELKKEACKAITLLEIYNIFSGIIVRYWPEVAEDLAGRVFDLLFKEWDLTSKIAAPPIKVRNDYYYSLEEDL